MFDGGAAVAMTVRDRQDSQLEALREVMRARRRQAHGWFSAWGRERERISAGMVGPLAKIRELGDGAGVRGGVKMRGCNPIERQCDRLERTLRIERYVSGMPAEWVMVLVGAYVHRETGEQLAQRLGITRGRVVGRLEDAQDRLMREFEADDAARVSEISRLLHSAI